MRRRNGTRQARALLNRREMLALTASAALSACRRRLSPPLVSHMTARPNVVVFLSDALRADHLECYDYARRTSPHLLQFSRNSLVFENHYAAASWTKPAIASLFTGVLPRIHQMVIEQWSPDYDEDLGLRVLDEGLTQIAQLFARAAYQSAWLLSNPHVVGELGFARGFDHYRYGPGETCAQQVDAALGWLEEGAREPFFLFIHVMDPHDPYLSTTEEFRALFGVSHEEALALLPASDTAELHDFHKLNWTQRKKKTGRLKFEGLSPLGVEYLEKLYDTEIRRMDAQFGRLLRVLDEQGVMDRTVVAFTSDHGEAFREHGAFYHGNSLFDNELHIPLILRLPGMTHGLKVPWTVSQCDLYPTLATLIGQEPPAHVQGETLIDSSLRLAVQGDRDVFAYLDRFRSDINAWEVAMVRGVHQGHDPRPRAPIPGV